jgi:hypothetical protein
LRAGDFQEEAGVPQPLDRFPVQFVGGRTVAEQRPAACFDAERELGTAGPRRLRQPLERGIVVSDVLRVLPPCLQVARPPATRSWPSSS